jgi:hypothetical protein
LVVVGGLENQNGFGKRFARRRIAGKKKTKCTGVIFGKVTAFFGFTAGEAVRQPREGAVTMDLSREFVLARELTGI